MALDSLQDEYIGLIKETDTMYGVVEEGVTVGAGGWGV